MRIFNKIFIALFLLITAFLVAVYIFVQANGKRILTEQLNALTDRPVTIGDVRLSFPLGLRVDDFEMAGALKAKEVRIQLGILVLTKKIVHIESLTLIDPVMELCKVPGEGIVFGAGAAGGIDPAADKPAPAKEGDAPAAVSSADHSSQVSFIIDSLLVRNGEIRYVDEYSSQGLKLTAQNVELFAKDVSVPPRTINIKYDLRATLFESPLSFSGSKVESSGWMNWGDKSMDAELLIVDNAGQTALKSSLKSKNNDMTVKGKVNIANLAPVKKESSEDQPSLKDMIFEGLQSSGMAIALDFQFKTKMDDFSPGAIAVSGNVDYQQPKKSVIEDFKNIGKQFEEIGKKFKENIEKPAVSGEGGQPLAELPRENTVPDPVK